jgi:hypothetical protein
MTTKYMSCGGVDSASTSHVGKSSLEFRSSESESYFIQIWMK